jgi:hypothetical protein
MYDATTIPRRPRQRLRDSHDTAETLLTAVWSSWAWTVTPLSGKIFLFSLNMQRTTFTLQNQEEILSMTDRLDKPPPTD